MPLVRFHTPQLVHLHSGKVRDSFRVEPTTRLIVTTDRISAFDRVLQNAIPDKGAVLNGLAAFWFARTSDIVSNHLIKTVDPQACLVREVEPIRVEMIVRGYLTGSMWRRYAQGARVFSGTRVEDGLRQHARFKSPILTPTTKEESDREITPEEIVSSGLVSEALYEEMVRASMRLFEVGTELLAARDILLVDTKYEFGILDGRLMLIDELHTPDSSRFWTAESYERDPLDPFNLDKEFIRAHLLSHGAAGTAAALPPEVVEEAAARYREIYRIVTGREVESSHEVAPQRLCANLVREGIIKDGFVVIVMGSPSDAEHCRRIAEVLASYDVFVDMRVVSAHRNPEDIASVLADYADAVEPGAIIAVAGLSNGLGGALAGSTVLPVVNCPPFKDTADLLANLNSSLMMPPGVPAVTATTPHSAALAALRSLNLPRLKDRMRHDMEEMKASLCAADAAMRTPRGRRS